MKALDGFSLKRIALISMLIDHTAAIVLEPFASSNSFFFVIYLIMRSIGRLSFPIFCFLLVEGFFHTRSREKYLLRLLLFAAVSEVPFDLSFHHVVFCADYQNVFVTLAIGFAALMVFDYFFHKSGKINLVAAYAFLAGFCGLAYLVRCDYGFYGVLAIFMFYIAHDNKQRASFFAVFILCFAGVLEAVAFVDCGIISLYQGKKGRGSKWLFYFFYPVHLLVLFFIVYFLKK